MPTTAAVSGNVVQESERSSGTSVGAAFSVGSSGDSEVAGLEASQASAGKRKRLSKALPALTIIPDSTTAACGTSDEDKVAAGPKAS